MNPTLPSPPAASTNPPEAADRQHRWFVGTLSYTSTGIAMVFFWLLWGDFAWSLKERSVMSMVQLLLKKFEASDLLTGLLIGTLPNAIAVILQPVISYRSDRHRGRWGRRLPFLIWTTPIAALGMIGLGFSPQLAATLHATLGASSPGVNPLSLILFAVFWTLFEFGTLAANVIFLGLINDIVPEGLLGRFFGLFRAMSLIAGIVFNYWILAEAEEHYKAIFIGIGIIYGVGFLMMCFRVKEGEYPPPKASDSPKPGNFAFAARTYLRECFSNPYYVWVFIGYNLCFVALAPINLFSLFFAKSLQMSMGDFGKLFAITYAISLTLSYFLGVLADRFHPLRVGIVASALYAIFSLWGGFFITDTLTFSIAFVAHGVLSGAFLTTTASFGQRLFPRARFAQFYSALMLVQAAGIMVVPLIIGAVLDYSHHNYRLTFVASGILSTLGVAACLVVHKRFMALGGPKNYQAPE
ncbi:MAG: MFS transporter [Candidatus Didemnitutus sp.]|nr:MFS transporter [Candidatus Didemnitutus sp.]